MAVHIVNRIQKSRLPERFRAVSHRERAVSRITSRPFGSGLVCSHLTGSLSCHRVNTRVREYQDLTAVTSVAVAGTIAVD